MADNCHHKIPSLMYSADVLGRKGFCAQGVALLCVPAGILFDRGTKFRIRKSVAAAAVLSFMPPCCSVWTKHFRLAVFQVMGMLPEELRNGVAVSINSSLFARVALLQHIFDPLDRAQVLYARTKKLDCVA